MYNKIYNPNTSRFVNINSNTGKYVLQNYISILKGGAAAGSAAGSEEWSKITKDTASSWIKSKWWLNRLFNYSGEGEMKSAKNRYMALKNKKYIFYNVDEVLPKFHWEAGAKKDTNFETLLQQNSWATIEKMILKAKYQQYYDSPADWNKICKAKYLMYKDYCERPYNMRQSDREVGTGDRIAMSRSEFVVDGINKDCWSLECDKYGDKKISEFDFRNIAKGCAICAALRENHHILYDRSNVNSQCPFGGRAGMHDDPQHKLQTSRAKTVTNNCNAQANKARAVAAAALKFIKQIFMMFDVNGNGRLNKDEYRDYVEAIGVWGSGNYTDDKWGYYVPRSFDEEDGISFEAFATNLYGKYRKGKAEADLNLCKKAKGL